jgi:fatty acid desaturase
MNKERKTLTEAYAELYKALSVLGMELLKLAPKVLFVLRFVYLSIFIGLVCFNIALGLYLQSGIAAIFALVSYIFFHEMEELATNHAKTKHAPYRYYD